MNPEQRKYKFVPMKLKIRLGRNTSHIDQPGTSTQEQRTMSRRPQNVAFAVLHGRQHQKTGFDAQSVKVGLARRVLPWMCVLTVHNV